MIIIMQKKYSAFDLMTAIFRGKAQIVCLIVFSVLALAAAAASAFLGEAYGTDDYFISVFILFISYYLPCFLVLLYFTMLAYSRFIFAVPMAKKLMTQTLPLLGAGICAVITLVAVILTGISLSVGLTDGNRMSDVLLVCALLSLVIPLCFSIRNSAGIGIFGCFFGVGMFAFAFVGEVAERTNPLYRLCRYGFGVRVEIAAVACVAAYVIGIPLSIWLAKKSYRVRSSKSMVNFPPAN